MVRNYVVNNRPKWGDTSASVHRSLIILELKFASGPASGHAHGGDKVLDILAGHVPRDIGASQPGPGNKDRNDLPCVW